MTGHGDSEALATAKGLTGALDGMTAQLGALSAYGHKNRRMIWGLIVSIVLDLILTVGIALVAVQAHDANATALSVKAAQVALCEAGNTARAQQVTLWTHLVAVSAPPPGATPAQVAAQKAKAAAFLAYVRKVFSSRDCAHVGR